jgi:hypothetical protein
VVNTFQSALNTRDFVVTSEILLGAGSGVDHVNEQAELLRDRVDGVLVTDNQSGSGPGRASCRASAGSVPAE